MYSSFGHFAASGEGDRRGEDVPDPMPLKSLPDNTKSSRSAWVMCVSFDIFGWLRVE